MSIIFLNGISHVNASQQHRIRRSASFSEIDSRVQAFPSFCLNYPGEALNCQLPTHQQLQQRLSPISMPSQQPQELQQDIIRSFPFPPITHERALPSESSSAETRLRIDDVEAQSERFKKEFMAFEATLPEEVRAAWEYKTHNIWQKFVQLMDNNLFPQIMQKDAKQPPIYVHENKIIDGNDNIIGKEIYQLTLYSNLAQYNEMRAECDKKIRDRNYQRHLAQLWSIPCISLIVGAWMLASFNYENSNESNVCQLKDQLQNMFAMLVVQPWFTQFLMIVLYPFMNSLRFSYASWVLGEEIASREQAIHNVQFDDKHFKLISRTYYGVPRISQPASSDRPDSAQVPDAIIHASNVCALSLTPQILQ